jgi:hypothetical protein
VLHAEADEVFGAAVVHADRHADDQGAFRLGQPREHAGVEVDVLGDRVQLTASHHERRGAFEQRGGERST